MVIPFGLKCPAWPTVVILTCYSINSKVEVSKENSVDETILKNIKLLCNLGSRTELGDFSFIVR